MAEGYGTFGREMKTSGKLHEMLNQPNISPEKLFEVANISGDITQNIQAFLSFCSKRKDFTSKMIKICLNSSYEDLQNEALKKVAQYTIEVLTFDEGALTDFLFNRHGDLKSGSEIQENADQGSNPTIESEAQRLFNDPPTKKQQAQWQKEADAFQKYQLIKMTLAHLKEENKNQTCLGFINKLYSSLLKREGNLFLQFLKQKPEYLDLFIKNINYFSMGNIIALTLSCEDKTGEYKYEELKKEIFEKMIKFSLENIEKSQNFDGFIAAAEQILNTTKQSYYEYFQDFKRCANVLVSQDTLRKYYQLLNKSELAFRNASTYLELVMKRINSQSQQHDYYRQNQNAEPTMNFQHAFFYNQFRNLLDLIEKSQSYSSMTRINYLGFLINLVKNMQNKGKDFNLPALDIFKRLIVFYSEQKVAGLIKNYLFQLLKLIIKKLKESEMQSLASWLLEVKIQQETITKLFKQISNVQNNSNTNSCFILSLMFDVQNKENTFLTNYGKQNNVNLMGTYEKYKTKLANYGQEDDTTSPVYDDTEFLSFKLMVKGRNNAFLKSGEGDSVDQELKEKDGKTEKEKEPETQVVGKNSVVIPVLNLPNKVDNTKVIIEEEIVQPVKISAQLSRQALIKDLKNTRIQLPQRLKAKKAPSEQQKKAEIKSEIKKQLILQSEILSQKIKPKTPPSKEPNASSPDPKPMAQKVISNGLHTQEQKYFIRHILLF